MNNESPEPRKKRKRKKKRFGKRLGQYLVEHRFFATMGCFVYRLISSSFRAKIIGRAFPARVFSGGGFIWAFWHSTLFTSGYGLHIFRFLYRKKPGAVMITDHRDGEMIAQVFEGLGHKTVRGSSTRGGMRAFIGALQSIRSGEILGITPDGPKGPAREAQIGVVTLALKTGRPILPVGSAVKWKIRLKTWDSFILPLPFSKAVICIGKPLYLSPDDSPKINQEKVKQAIDAVNEKAEEELRKV